MSFRPRIVKGGTHESKTCDCTAEGENWVFKKLTLCTCTNSKDFVGNVPDRWICPDCSNGKHKF